MMPSTFRPPPLAGGPAGGGGARTVAGVLLPCGARELNLLPLLCSIEHCRTHHHNKTNDFAIIIIAAVHVLERMTSVAIVL